MHFSVLIYGEVEQNIDFNNHFNLMFLFDLFNFLWYMSPKNIPPKFLYYKRKFFDFVF